MDQDKHNNNIEREDFTPKTREAFNKWFDSFDDSTGYLDSLSFAEKEMYRKNLLQKTRSNLNSGEGQSSSTQRHLLQSWMTNPITKVAAVLMIGVLLSIAGFYGSKILDPKDTKQVAILQKVTKVGELSKLTLPDSTIVWLGAASTLKYPKAFTGSQRSVELDGEAYFEVTHNDTLPFIVTSGSVETRVLGTKFNVKAYEEDPEATVTLVSGKIEVTSGDRVSPVILSPDEQLRYNKESSIQEVKSINASMVNAWKDKELVFLREPFAQIAKTFERWYGVKFLFEDQSLKEEVFVYHFKEFSLDRSMEMLSKLADFSYEIKNKKVIVSEK